MKPLLACLLLIALSGSAAFAETIDFETSGVASAVPKDFTPDTTGRGQKAIWKLQETAGAPSGKLTVAQTSTDATDDRFPVLVYDRIMARDATISVKFKPVSGSNDQAAGLVWRYQDRNNYYIVRANALESNVVLYIVRNGERIDLPVKGRGRTYGAQVPAISKTGWSTLAVSVKGKTFAVSFNGRPLYEVEDTVFTQPGKIGLWTKSDSVTLFDDFSYAAAASK